MNIQNLIIALFIEFIIYIVVITLICFNGTKYKYIKDMKDFFKDIETDTLMDAYKWFNHDIDFNLIKVDYYNLNTFVINTMINYITSYVFRRYDELEETDPELYRSISKVITKKSIQKFYKNRIIKLHLDSWIINNVL